MKKLLLIFCLIPSLVFGAFSEFYVQTTGDNLNAGSTTDNAAPHTYTSAIVVGGWNSATGVFTVATGDPAADGVVAGDFASVYVTAGATIATFIGRVTARDSTTITVSLTAKSGTAPATDALGATTLKVGGAWKGPNAAIGFPFGFVAGTMTNAAADMPRVNFKNGTNYAITAAMTHAVNGPTQFQGYTGSPGDGGRAVIDGGTSGTSFALLTISSAQDCEFRDFIFGNNGATGAANGIVQNGGNRMQLQNIVVHDVRGTGFQCNSGGTMNVIECEAYACNQSNTSLTAGFLIQGGTVAIRCISHDNVGSNSSGFYMSSGSATLLSCIADTNGAKGFHVSSVGGIIMLGCDSYGNVSDGLKSESTSDFYISNCNFVKNGGWGILLTTSTSRHGAVVNCGFGSGTQVNTGGATSLLGGITESGSVTYASNVTPWVDPANGDFRVNLAAARHTGRGTFTQTASSYTGTVGYPDIGAAFHKGDETTGIIGQ